LVTINYTLGIRVRGDSYAGYFTFLLDGIRDLAATPVVITLIRHRIDQRCHGDYQCVGVNGSIWPGRPLVFMQIRDFQRYSPSVLLFNVFTLFTGRSCIIGALNKFGWCDIGLMEFTVTPRGYGDRGRLYILNYPGLSKIWKNV